MPKKFQQFSSGIIAVIKGIFIFFNIVNNYKYTNSFKLLVYLSARTYTAVLFKGLHACNLLLLKGFFYLKATAFYKISIEFLFGLL